MAFLCSYLRHSNILFIAGICMINNQRKQEIWSFSIREDAFDIERDCFPVKEIVASICIKFYCLDVDFIEFWVHRNIQIKAFNKRRGWPNHLIDPCVRLAILRCWWNEVYKTWRIYLVIKQFWLKRIENLVSYRVAYFVFIKLVASHVPAAHRNRTYYWRGPAEVIKNVGKRH